MPITYKKKLNTGGQIGTALGAGATSFIPGVGPALAPIGGMVGGAIGSLLDRNKTPNKPKVIGQANQGYKYGGKMKKKYPLGGNLSAAQPIGNDAVRYDGPQHEQGGIPIDDQGNPTDPNQATAEVEGGETRQGDYIFSDELMVPESEMTFAEAHEMLLEQGAPEEQIEELAQLQEQVRQEQGVDEQPQQVQPDQQMIEQPIEQMPNGGRLPKSPKKNPSLTQKTKKVATNAAKKTKGTIARGASSAGSGLLSTGKGLLKLAGRASAPMVAATTAYNLTSSMYGGETPLNLRKKAIENKDALSRAASNRYKAERNLEKTKQQAIDENWDQYYRNGGSLKKYQYGGNQNKLISSPNSESSFDAVGMAQRLAPSVTRLATAAFTPKPKNVQQVQPQTISEQNPAFASGRNQLTSGFRANPTQGGYAQYTSGVNQLTASKAQDRSQREQFNAQTRGRTDQVNRQIDERNFERQAQDKAARIGLVDQAIQAPLTAAAADRRGEQQMIANVMTSADRVTDPQNWAQTVRARLKAIGISDSKIEQILSEYQRN